MIWSLLLAHLLADFPLQTESIFELKKRNIWGIMLHSGIVTILSVLFVPHLLVIISAWALLFCSHTFMDWIKVRLTEINPKFDNILFFIIDQLFHISIIFLVAILFPGPSVLKENIVIYLCSYITIGPFSMIFLFYFKRLFYGEETSLPISPRNWFGTLERMIIFTLVIAPSPFYFLIPFVLMIRGLVFKEEQDTALDLAASCTIAVFLGLLIRILM